MANDIGHILALGKSIENYIIEQPKGFSVGVNDIERYAIADYLVCVDHPGAFTLERRQIIERSKPKQFLTHIKEWAFMPGYTPIELIAIDPTPETVMKPTYLSHNNSPYVAIQVAAKLGAKTIVLHGVDLNEHKTLSKFLNGTIARYLTLGTALQAHGIELYVGSSKSFLSNFIPVWQK